MNYINECLRTEPVVTEEMLARLNDPGTIRLLHAAIGKVTEAGEFIDMLKKHIFQGRPMDRINAIEELGDGHWYDALAADELQTSFKEIQDINIIKLKLRYPDKFSEHHANNRDLTAERRVLEQGGESYYCQDCDKVFTYNQILVRTLEVPGLDVYYCPECRAILEQGGGAYTID